ncbi:hypothetical protein FMM05_10630 [Flavobacterium zepuense]|uniref:Lipoprotein n=1 Tax=Flavobacterium zepuense TaxID=2593302 RepID=A0A552V1D9_9FLAO|nr:hypothetical protein [Flavobacterium zepuense]TRW24280.1 hypothetical protein FMM05_10630 [Flavobacterium zepuense]
MKNFKFCFALFLSLILFSCQDDDITDQREFEPTTVIVKTNGNVTTQQVFELINSYDHTVSSVDNEVYTSLLAPENLDYVKGYFTDKPYVDANWPVNGYLHYQTNVITIFPRLINIKDPANQAGFLQATQTLQLQQTGKGFIITFHVPAGKENEWANLFRTHNNVEWAELNYISQVITN